MFNVILCVHVYVCVCVGTQRSRSAFSLTSDDSPQKGPEDQTGVGGFPEYASLKREAKATALPSWKSVDRLDNSSKSLLAARCSTRFTLEELWFASDTIHFVLNGAV